MNPGKLISFIVLWCLCLGLWSCGNSADRETEESTGPRLAVLSPAIAIMLRDLASAEFIVGRHGYDMVLPKELPVVGDETGIDYEALVGVRPTHVVIERGAKGIPPRLAEMAPSQGWTIVELPMLTLADVEAAVPALVELVGTDAARSRANTLRQEMDRAWAFSARTEALLGRTLVLASTDPVGAMGPGSFHWEMIKRMGMTPLPEQGSPYMTLSHEDLVRINPDTIILLRPGIPSRFGVEIDEFGEMAVLPIKAFQERDLIVVTHPLSQTPSTALIEVAREILQRYAHIRWDPLGSGSETPAATP